MEVLHTEKASDQTCPRDMRRPVVTAAAKRCQGPCRPGYRAPKAIIRVADLVITRGRQHQVPRSRERYEGPAESKTHGMYGSLLHGSREIPAGTTLDGGCGLGREGKDPNACLVHLRGSRTQA